ncbi:hypothetical protein [Chromohalobacter sp. 296-RDG]|uniref:hypothetical protein n=1 Tax=Chromohalobacter sp. 296-RDG TaxID=2994062 RepID=UPI002469771A|nr:hypothetical protein [Chromohalobacter sp. 296-RDG]
MGTVTQFRHMNTLTPAGEAACERFESDLHEAITKAEDSGLCYGMIIASLSQAQWWMNQRCQESDD